MVSHTRSKRALLAGTFAKELLGAIVQIRGDRPLLHNLAGVLSLNGGLREGFLQDEVWQDGDASQSLIRAIIDRERRVELGQYDIHPDLICVIVTHSSQDLVDLETLIQEVTSNLPERHEVHWIHLLEEEGMKMEEMRSMLNMRFGPDTWQQIVDERSRRITEIKEAQKKARIEKRRKDAEFWHLIQQGLIVFGVFAIAAFAFAYVVIIR